MNKKTLVFLVFIFCLYHITIAAKKTSPIQFGLREATTDVERFWVLYKTHTEALKKGNDIQYAGIDTIKIEIPKEAKPIPLLDRTDFGNVVIIVKNRVKNYTLFLMQNPLEKYETRIELLEGKKRISDQGAFIVVIEDSTLWVKNREGYGSGFARKDILYVNNGKIEGSIISSYKTFNSKPQFSRCFVRTNPKTIQNITVIRDSSSLYKTAILKIENQYNLKICNLSIKTPHNKLYGDNAIRLDNCYKVKLLDTTIDGTYSQKNKYGYGITMINVSDVEIKNLRAHADWGVFGNNNISNIRLKNCDINRFDVHCYGKDVFVDKCVFRNLYNQFSSMYGTVAFENCVFINFVPVLIEPSYNAYTKFDLYFKSCMIIASKEKCYLISGGNIQGFDNNSRDELKKQEYPNLYIDAITIKKPLSLNQYYIYKVNNQYLQWPIDAIPQLKGIKNLIFEDIK